MSRFLRPATMMQRFGLSRVDVAVASVLIVMLAVLLISAQSRANDRAETLEAANFLSDVRRAQVDHFDRHGRYAAALGELDLRVNSPTAFDISTIDSSITGWSIKAVRRRASSDLATTLSIDQRGWIGKHASPSTAAPAASLVAQQSISHPSK